MSEKNLMVLALIEMLLNSKDHPGRAAAPLAAPAAPLRYGVPPAERAGAAPASTVMPMQGAAAPRHPFSREAEKKAAYVSGKHNPIGEEQDPEPPPKGWAAGRRFGQRFSYPQYSGKLKGPDKQFAYPVYGLRGERPGQRYSAPGFNPGGSGGEEAGADAALWGVRMDSGFKGLSPQSPGSGFANQPWPWQR
jgi:hypothetical protein